MLPLVWTLLLIFVGKEVQMVIKYAAAEIAHWNGSYYVCGKGMYLITLEGLIESFFKIYCYKIMELSVRLICGFQMICISLSKNHVKDRS